MAIISAGVIMNVIFAFVFASIAYLHGVNEVPCDVGGLVPGDAAWRAGLQPGDQIVQIGDIAEPAIQGPADAASPWATISKTACMFTVVRRFARRLGRGRDTIDFTLVPDRDRRTLAPMIGIRGRIRPRCQRSRPLTTRSASSATRSRPIRSGRRGPQDRRRDGRVKVGRRSAALASHPGTVRLTHRPRGQGESKTPPEELTVDFPPGQ